MKLVDENIEDPAAVPIYWVAKWVDYSDKYGLGYQLSDGSVGVLFNDQSRLLLATNEYLLLILYLLFCLSILSRKFKIMSKSDEWLVTGV